MSSSRRSSSRAPLALVVGCVIAAAALAAWLLIPEDPTPDTLESGPDVAPALLVAELPDPADAESEASAEGTEAIAASRLAPAVFVGRVVDRRGLPLPEVAVWVVPGRETLAERGHDLDEHEEVPSSLFGAGTSDAEGRFEITLLHAPGASGSEWPDVPEIVLERPGFVSAGHPCAGFVEGRYDAGAITLLAAATVSGLVVDERSAPIRAASVTVWPAIELPRPPGSGWPRSMKGYGRASSGSDGHFKVSGLWPCVANVHVNAEDHLPLDVFNVVVREGEPVGLGTLVLEDGRTVEGLVVDKDGQPVSGAEVRATTWKPPWTEQPREKESLFATASNVRDTIDWQLAQIRKHPLAGTEVTDHEGRFRIGGLPDEVVRLYVTLGRHEPVVAIAAPDVDEAVRIVVEPLRELTITVRPCEDGEPPITGGLDGLVWRVMVEPASIFIDDHGRERWNERRRPLLVHDRKLGLVAIGVGPHETELTVSAPGYGWSGVARHAQTPWQFHQLEGNNAAACLRREAVITGTVLLPDGTPAPGVRVDVVQIPDPRIPGRYEPQEAHTDSTGSFRVTRLPLALWSITASAPGFARSQELQITTAVGQVVGPVVLQLSEPGSLQGLVVRSDGSGAVGVRVTAQSDDQQDSGWAISDPQGRFLIRDLLPGGYSVTAPPGGMAWVQVDAGAPTEMTLYLRAWPLVRGRTFAGRGAEPWIEVLATPTPDQGGFGYLPEMGGSSLARPAATLSDSFGDFELTLPGPGIYEVHARSAAGAISAPVQVELGWSEQQEVSLPLGGSTLDGLVLRQPEGAPQPGARLLLRLAGSDIRHELVSDEAGAFRVHGLVPGSYSLEARVEGWPETLVMLEVPSERVLDVVIGVSPGAAVSGKVGPLHKLPSGRVESFRVGAWRLGAREPTATGSIAGDGSYHIEGLGAGRWIVLVGYAFALDPAFRSMTDEPVTDARSSYFELGRGTIELAFGSDATLDIDLSQPRHFGRR